MDRSKIINFLRSTGAIVLGLVVTFILLIAVEGISALIHPWPDDFGGTAEEVAEQVRGYAGWELVLLGGIGWGGIMYTVTWLATRLGSNRHMGHGIAMAAIFLGLVIMNLSMLPYPIWYWPFMLIVLPIAAFLGTKTGTASKITSSS